jgi:hypothetical protein
MLPVRQRRRLLDPNDVIFQPQVIIDILLMLEMPCNVRDPLANVSRPRCERNSCGKRPNNRFRKSSEFSMFDLPTFRSSRHFNPGTR